MNKIGLFCAGIIAFCQFTAPITCHTGVNNDGSEGDTSTINPALISINNELVAVHAQLNGLNGPYPYVFDRPGTVCGRAVLVVQKAAIITHSLRGSREKSILQSQMLCVAQLIHDQITKPENISNNKFQSDVVNTFGQNATNFQFIRDLVATHLREPSR